MGLRCTGYTDPKGNHTTFESDALDRVITTIHPDGSKFKTSYDCCASTGTTDENGNTTRIDRTPLLRITKHTDAGGNAFGYILDNAGRVVEKIMPDDTKNQYTYNSFGKTVKETDPYSESVLLGYDLNGLLASITDQSGNASTFLRSENGKVTSRIIGSSAVTYNRDSLDRVTSFINSRGQAVHYTYNADGLIQTRNSTDINDQYAYDEVNRLSSASNPAGIISVEYNERNAISHLTYEGNQQIYFFYDLNNSLVKTSYNDNSESILKRDSRGRIISIIMDADSVGFTFDAASNVKSIHRSNGINTIIRRNKTNKILALRLFNDADTLMKWDYTRNAMGYITREERTGILCNDSIFMPADTGGFYQQGNQISTWHNLTYDYDEDGNLIQVNPGVFSATYDNLNRLTGWTQDEGNFTAQYFYNAQGYVTIKQVQNGTSHLFTISFMMQETG